MAMVWQLYTDTILTEITFDTLVWCRSLFIYNNSVHAILFHIMIFFTSSEHSINHSFAADTYNMEINIFLYKCYGILPQLDRSISIYVPMNVRHIWRIDHKKFIITTVIHVYWLKSVSKLKMFMASPCCPSTIVDNYRFQLLI